MVKSFSVIMAVDMKFGVGINNKLPWPWLPEDLKHFKDVTKNSVVVMGKNTWKSIKSKPLPNRDNIVISNSIVEGADYTMAGEVSDIMDMISDIYPNEHIFFIGGPSLVEEAVKTGRVENIFITYIDDNYICDTFLNSNILDNYIQVHEEILKEANPTATAVYYVKR